jgi:hypothetical protein
VRHKTLGPRYQYQSKLFPATGRRSPRLSLRTRIHIVTALINENASTELCAKASGLPIVIIRPLIPRSWTDLNDRYYQVFQGSQCRGRVLRATTTPSIQQCVLQAVQTALWGISTSTPRRTRTPHFYSSTVEFRPLKFFHLFNS